MRILLYICKCIFILLTHRPLQTIYFNFKMLPFRQAILLPIFIYTKAQFRSLNGKIIIEGRIVPNMIHIGDNTRYVTTSRGLSIWTINGSLIFSGKINFYHGTYVYVAQNAILKFGNNSFVGSDSKIICREAIYIGDSVEITWENQIYDTSFHYVNIDGEVGPLTKPVIINNNVWIGNRTTISKGTILPSNSIVASNSMTNKDYSAYGENCLFVGVPAICKKCNVNRIWGNENERKYDENYGYIRYKL